MTPAVNNIDINVDKIYLKNISIQRLVTAQPMRHTNQYVMPSNETAEVVNVPEK